MMDKKKVPKWHSIPAYLEASPKKSQHFFAFEYCMLPIQN
jgi:hypothetical protein